MTLTNSSPIHALPHGYQEPSAEKSASDGCDWPGESKIQKVAPPLTSISALPDRRSYDESERKFYGGGDSDDSGGCYVMCAHEVSSFISLSPLST